MRRSVYAALFEDAPYDKKQQNLIQTTITSLISSLKKIGAEAAITRSYNPGKWRVIIVIVGTTVYRKRKKR